MARTKQVGTKKTKEKKTRFSQKNCKKKTLLKN